MDERFDSIMTSKMMMTSMEYQWMNPLIPTHVIDGIQETQIDATEMIDMMIIEEEIEGEIMIETEGDMMVDEGMKIVEVTIEEVTIEEATIEEVTIAEVTIEEMTIGEVTIEEVTTEDPIAEIEKTAEIVKMTTAEVIVGKVVIVMVVENIDLIM